MEEKENRIRKFNIILIAFLIMLSIIMFDYLLSYIIEVNNYKEKEHSVIKYEYSCMVN